MSHYHRNACPRTESLETLYALGAEDSISGYAVRPPGPSVIIEGLPQISDLIARWQTLHTA